MLGSAWNAKSAAISSARETTSDMEALRSYFDTNGDGKLTSADAAFAQFKVLETNVVDLNQNIGPNGQRLNHLSSGMFGKKLETLGIANCMVVG